MTRYSPSSRAAPQGKLVFVNFSDKKGWRVGFVPNHFTDPVSDVRGLAEISILRARRDGNEYPMKGGAGMEQAGARASTSWKTLVAG